MAGKTWNYPSTIAFGLALAAAVGLFALGHTQQGVAALLIAGGIAAPQPTTTKKED
jgi:hypothetical protein